VVVKIIVFCPHLDRDDKEKNKLTKMFFRKQHEGQIFVIQELCDNCFVKLTKGITQDEYETTH